MDEEDVVHLYNGRLLGHERNEIESFIETVIETEIRKTHINTCMQNQEKWYK